MTAHFPMNLEKALMDKIYIISFTEKGAELSLKLQNIYHDALLYSKYPAKNIKMLDLGGTKDLENLSVTYAEIRFAPQLSTKQGLSQAQVVEAVIRGAKRGMEDHNKIRVGLILCCMRGEELFKDNMETIEVAKQYLGDVVCAVDLAGAESLFPTELFEDIFQKAKDYEIPMTIHAGEADGAESVWKALSYGTKRIGHGVRAIEDPELIKKLVEDQITLEVCVTSNYQTKVVESIEVHPIRKLFDAGVRVTINSDNMTVSDTNIQKEIEILKTMFGFQKEELMKMEQYAADAKFLK